MQCNALHYIVNQPLTLAIMAASSPFSLHHHPSSPSLHHHHTTHPSLTSLLLHFCSYLKTSFKHLPDESMSWSEDKGFAMLIPDPATLLTRSDPQETTSPRFLTLVDCADLDDLVGGIMMVCCTSFEKAHLERDRERERKVVKGEGERGEWQTYRQT